MDRARHALYHPLPLRPGAQDIAGPAQSGQVAGVTRTGLLGGSFNPAHRAHRAITIGAAEALGLDEVWWLVSPGNPLKEAEGMAPLPARSRSARRMARGLPVRVTA